ncbi:MAG: AAA family ATPase [Gemmatimonadota bacterium]|nr:AAA family ATPase [Gemmatimonadota bacterium]
MIQITLLGPPILTIEARPAPPELLWRKHLGLLAYLTCAPARGATRAHLLDLLWGDKPEAAARHSLNEALRVIRRGVGDEAVDTSGDRIRLVAEVDSDLARIEALQGAGDTAAAARCIRGEFLEGFEIAGAAPFEDWLIAMRMEWRRRGSDLLAGEAEQCLDRGDIATAVELAERAASLDTEGVRSAVAAMKALALHGDRAGALAHHDRLRASLTELGAAVPAPVSELATRIRTGRAGPGASPPEVIRNRRPPLLGRERALADLLASCRLSQAGEAQLGVILGAAGTGKSRLLEEVLTRARLEGATPIVLRAVPADAGDPGGGLRALCSGPLLEAPGVAAAPAGALATLATVHPDWAERFPGALGAEPHSLRQAVVDLLRASAEESPVVLAVDDAQWLDADSLRAVIGLLRDLSGDRVTVLLTAALLPPRPELDDALARLGRDLPGTLVRLTPLPLEALEQLVCWNLPSYSVAEGNRLARRIASDSGGLPFLAVELLHAVAGGLDLVGSPAVWPAPLHTLDQTRPGELPDAIVAAIRIDFRRLSASAQQVLAAAAVLGERVPARHIGQALGLEPELLHAALDELEWSRWLQAEPRGYSHVARIAQEVIAKDLVTPGQRRRILEQAGAA